MGPSGSPSGDVKLPVGAMWLTCETIWAAYLLSYLAHLWVYLAHPWKLSGLPLGLSVTCTTGQKDRTLNFTDFWLSVGKFTRCKRGTQKVTKIKPDSLENWSIVLWILAGSCMDPWRILADRAKMAHKGRCKDHSVSVSKKRKVEERGQREAHGPDGSWPAQFFLI